MEVWANIIAPWFCHGLVDRLVFFYDALCVTNYKCCICNDSLPEAMVSDPDSLISDPDPGFRWNTRVLMTKKFKNIYSWKNLIFF